MSFILDLVVKLVDPIINIVVQKVTRHVGYVFRYEKKMKELEDEKKKLEKHMGKIVEKIEEAKNQGLIVKTDVEEWTQKAENMKHEVEELMNAKAINESTRCLKFPCPNLVSRYKMSKQSEQRLGSLKGHIEDGNFDPVAHPAQRRLELQFTTSGDFVPYDSRASVLKKIIDGLRNPTINTIGVYGTGGVGKTKAVEEVAKQVSEHGIFDEVVIVNVSHDVNIRKIQGVLADRISLSFKSETEEGRNNELYTRLNNGKNNLVILDDIWRELDLRVIGIPLRNGNKGCKVIFTTRNFNVLEKMKVDVSVPVKELTEEEAWDLFKKSVDVTFVSAELQHIAELVCKECRGLPVAIRAVGGALVRKDDKHVWSDVLDQLQNSMWEGIDGIDPKMYTSLRLSYDYLGKEVKEAQSILLLCCLYPEDADIPVNLLVYHCIARKLLGPSKNKVEKARDRVLTLVGSLKTRSLLLNGKNGDFVKMHDVVRDVVISIAKSDEQYLVKDAIDEWPNEYLNEKSAAVSVCFNELKEVPNELICPGLHTLRIESKDSSFQFPDSFFNGVRELRILELKGISMLSPPSSLANLSKLRTLILVNCQLEDMPFLKGLRSNLEVLVIESSGIKALPTELGELSHLRVLLLNESHKLELIPAGVISKLTHLEELRFPDEFDFRVYNKSGEVVEDTSRATLSELSSLTRLTSLSVFIPNDTPVPDLNQFINFGNLVSYRLAVGLKFYSEPYSGRKIVKLADTTYNDVFATLLERAEKVHLCRVEGLEKGILDRKGTGLFEVEHLVIECCNGLDSLSSRTSFSKLTRLDVERCSFKFLFTSSYVEGLQQLRELNVENCQLLEEIIGTEDEKDGLDQFNPTLHFSKLKELALRDVPKLISFGPKGEKTTAEGDSLSEGQPLFSEKHIFLALEHLIIWSLENITEIWDKHVVPKTSFPRLSQVNVKDCNKLVNVFPSHSYSWAQSLQTIKVNGCRGLQVVFSITEEEEDERDGPNNFSIIFPQLRSVELFCLGKIKCFCGNSTRSEPPYLFDPQVRCPDLERLHIERLENITEIWDNHVVPTTSFPRLLDVYIRYCDKLVNVFSSYLWAKSLQSISIWGCIGVQVIFSISEEEDERDGANNCSISFPKLHSVELMDLEKLECFCGNFNRSEPQYLFDHQVIFPALKHLHIQCLENITEIWDKHVVPTTSFPRLENMSVHYCDKVVNVFPSYSDSWAQSMQTIFVSNCRGLLVVFSITEEERDSANNCSIIFPQLSSLHLGNLEKLERFYGNSNRSEPLYLFDSKVIFPALELLSIRGFESITEIWDKHVVPKTSFPRLSQVNVEDCDKLVNAFPSYSYSWAQSLQSITIRSCRCVQVVFSIIEEEERDGPNNCSIIFPRLRSVVLSYLEKLKCFCGNSTRSEPLYLFDPQVQFPALEDMTLFRLPCIQTFREQVSAREVIFPAIKKLEIDDVKLYIDGNPNTSDLESKSE